MDERKYRSWRFAHQKGMVTSMKKRQYKKGTTRKTASIFLCFVLTITALPAIMGETANGSAALQSITPVYSASTETGFPDLNIHWAKPYVDALMAIGVYTPFKDGLFHPNEFIGINQFVTIFLSEYHELYPSSDDFAPTNIKQAVENGLIDGYNDSRPDVLIDRLAAVKFCHLFIGSFMAEEEAEYVSPAEQLLDYNMCKSCLAHVEQLYVKGIVVGRPGPLFDGDAYLTRAEAAVIIAKTLYPSLRTPPIAYQSEAKSLVTSETVANLLKYKENAVLLDVRTQEEYEVSHIHGSILMSMDKLVDSDIDKPFDKDSYIIVYGKADSLSRRAYEYLLGAGYEHVYDFGSIDDWPYTIDAKVS